MDALFKMLPVALKCDYTRVATMELCDNGGGNGNTFPWISVNRKYHMLAQRGQSSNKAKVDKWLFEQVAILVAELDAVDEGALRIGMALNLNGAHNILLTTLANAMGLPINQVGTQYSGNISQLLV